MRRQDFLRTALGSAAGLVVAPRAIEAALAAPRFETRIAVSADARYPAVTALDVSGAPLATSKTLRLP